MNSHKNHITVFEHQSIKIGDKFDIKILNALQKHYGDNGVDYFSLINNGVRFNSFVGVLQIGKTVIEILPKADNTDSDDGVEKWRDILIGMLRAVGNFNIQAPTNTSLKLQSNSILDLYFELFIKKVEVLFHSGLVKKYHKKEQNLTALKGSLKFSKQIQKNLIHQERFFVRHTTYDVEHILHKIIYKTILLLRQINTNSSLQSRIGALLLYFPEMPNIEVNNSTFKKLSFNRKTESYKEIMLISKLILLNYHPDISRGQNDILAIMFDMNKLWEKFVYISLRNNSDAKFTVDAQNSEPFWKIENAVSSRLVPDILINKGKDNCIVLDTKWKVLKEKNPSISDLRQMYAYHKFFNAKHVALVYPGLEDDTPCSTGSFCDSDKADCSVIKIAFKKLETFQTYISDTLKPILES